VPLQCQSILWKQYAWVASGLQLVRQNGDLLREIGKALANLYHGRMGRGQGKVVAEQSKRVSPPKVLPLESAIEVATREEFTFAIDVLEDFSDRYGAPRCGRNRAVFVCGDGYVVKIPFTWEGLGDNEREGTWSNPEIPLAECRLETVLPSGLKILWMEEVVPTKKDLQALPTWCSFVDGCQVGHTRDGRLVAYDI